MHDQFANGQPFPILDIVDDVTKERLGAIPDTSISGRRVVRKLTAIIASGKPMQNGFVESFNGRMRDELLNETVFFDLDHARAKIAGWVSDFNLQRPHSSLGYLTPAAFAANLTATDDRLRNPDQLRRSSVANPALHGAKHAEALIAVG